MQSMEHLRDEREFDCRRYVRPGDLVMIKTNTSSLGKEVDVAEGIVASVYAAHIQVWVNGVIEGVNRWNIRKINGRPVGNSIGYFSGMAVRA